MSKDGSENKQQRRKNQGLGAGMQGKAHGYPQSERFENQPDRTQRHNIQTRKNNLAPNFKTLFSPPYLERNGPLSRLSLLTEAELPICNQRVVQRRWSSPFSEIRTHQDACGPVEGITTAIWRT